VFSARSLIGYFGPLHSTGAFEAHPANNGKAMAKASAQALAAVKREVGMGVDRR